MLFSSTILSPTLLSSTLLASWWNGFASFDWQAALVVGGIMVVSTILVLTVAILTPVIAIQAGATLLGTASAVLGIATITGIIAGTAAGIHWGREGQLKRLEQIETIKKVSNRLDIVFEPTAGDSKRAADFECILISYDETDLSNQPTVTTRKQRIKADNGPEFFNQIERQMNLWFNKRVEGDKDQLPRKVYVFMSPFPGDGVYERIKQLAESQGSSIVNRTETEWKSATE